jgi:hypothetical protein
MIATGITDKPSAARWIVESVMAEVRNAGWGEALRVPLSGEPPTDAELAEWPPPGEVWVCRRAQRCGYKWMPLFPAEPDTEPPGICHRFLQARVAGEAGTAWLGLRWRQWAGPRAGHDWIGACLEDVAAVGVVAAAAWQAG